MKKGVIKNLLLKLAVALSIIMLSGCPNSSSEIEKFTISYSSSYAESDVPVSFQVEKDFVVTANYLPELTYEGWIFCGWYDGELKVEAGKYKVTKNVTFTAKWEPQSVAEYKVIHKKLIPEIKEYITVEEDTQTLTGKIGEYTEAVAKNYPGYTAHDVIQEVITPKGLEISIYYDPVLITVNFYSDAEGKTVYQTIEGYYGYPLNANFENPVLAGYSFDSWNKEIDTIFTENKSYYPVFKPLSGIEYKILHNIENANDSCYTVIETEIKKGTTDEMTDAAVKQYPGFEEGVFTNEKIKGDGSTEINVYYRRKTVVLEFYIFEGDTEVYSRREGKFGTEYSVPELAYEDRNENPGYIFAGWNVPAVQTYPEENAKYYAVWTPDTHVFYYVRRHFEKEMSDEYELDANKSSVGIGTTGCPVQFDVREYEGYEPGTYDETITVSATEETYVDVYYKRKTVTVTYKINETDTEPLLTVTGKYGTSLAEPDTPEKQGYIFSNWQYKGSDPDTYYNKFTDKFGKEDQVYFASFRADFNTPYVIEHYQQNAENDEYTLEDSKKYYGITDSFGDIYTKSYTGFNTNPSFTNVPIAADGSTVIKLYYDRKLCSIEFDLKGGEFDLELDEENKIWGKYGAPVPAVPDPVKEGFVFDNWNASYVLKRTFNGNETLIALWKENSTIQIITVSYDIELKVTETEGNSYVIEIIVPEKTSVIENTVWMLDGQTVTGTTTTLTVEKENLQFGVHEINVLTEKDGLECSGHMQFMHEAE